MFPNFHNFAGPDDVSASDPGAGTRDGIGAGDHDRPYTPRRPNTLAPFPFTTHEYLRLLLLRSRVRSAL